MDGQIILNIKDNSKLAFFMELIKNLDFVSVKEVVIDKEEAEDIKLYDKAKKGKLEFIEAEQLFKQIEKER
ncbi:MAG: hypothetical protein KAT68_19330 [Bacteroidales bacterium]|nr:hypothetical protein [Bacteroidales bacterium]